MKDVTDNCESAGRAKLLLRLGGAAAPPYQVIVLIVLLAGVFARAQSNNLESLLQQGLLEEQANGNLDAAIADYRSLALEFDKDRQLAATAVFRLGECYRAQGKTNEAVAQYQRVLREFSEQEKLATMSRQNLVGIGATVAEAKPSENAAAKLWNDVKDLSPSRLEKLLPILVTETGLTEIVHQRDLAADIFSNARAEYGTENPKYRTAQAMWEAANKRVSDTIDGVLHALKLRAELSQSGVKSAANASSDDGSLDEDREIRRIQQMLQNSPDLIDGDVLILAANRGQLRVANFLLDHGADVNRKYHGTPPLHMAAMGGQKTMVELLLSRGANVNARDGSGETALLTSARIGYWAVFEVLLAHNADVNARAQGRTALSYAAENGNLEMVKMLLATKADPNLEGPLHFAIWKQNAAISELLLNAGANPDQPANWTPLDVAVRNHDLVAVKLLLGHGAGPNIKNVSGSTALEVAKEELRQNVTGEQKTQLDDIVDLLHKHGALDILPNWDRIEVSGSSGQDPYTVFAHGTNVWNRFTLLESILDYYFTGFAYLHPVPGGGPPVGFNYSQPFPGSTTVPQPRGKTMPFPDLARVLIVRPSHNSTNEAKITVNLLDGTNNIDCAKDLPLEFGDVVEIPQRDHSLGEPPSYLTDNQISSIINYLHGTAHLVVHGQKADLPLDPYADLSFIGPVLRQTAAQQLILSSSGLSRVKVTRHDPKTGKVSEWILDCSNPSSSPDLRLRDGDLIEVPEKQ
jgi:ankyrin repeat protein